jgi:hypothetical protein
MAMDCGEPISGYFHLEHLLFDMVEYAVYRCIMLKKRKGTSPRYLLNNTLRNLRL